MSQSCQVYWQNKLKQDFFFLKKKKEKKTSRGFVFSFLIRSELKNRRFIYFWLKLPFRCFDF